MRNFQERTTCLPLNTFLYDLRATWNQTIRYSHDSHENTNVLWDWVDADWAGDTDTRRSHTKYIVMMKGDLISWKCQRQDNVSLATSKAEFVAASQAEAIYLRETLTSFGFSQTKAILLTLLYEDNLACVAISENPVR